MKSIIITFIFRAILVLWLYISSLQPWTKIFFITTLDNIKNLAIKEKGLAKNDLYQKYDKILDTFSYFIILEIIKKESLLSLEKITVLTIIFCFRFFGIILYLFSKNRKILFYTSDLFREILLLFYFTNKNHCYWFIIILIIKLIIEYHFHYIKGGLSSLINKIW